MKSVHKNPITANSTLLSIFQTWLVSKMKSHKNIVEPVLLEICELVNLDEFANVVEELVCVKCKQAQEDEKDPRLNTDSKNPCSRLNHSVSQVGVQLRHYVSTAKTPYKLNFNLSMYVAIKTKIQKIKHSIHYVTTSG